MNILKGWDRVMFIYKVALDQDGTLCHVINRRRAKTARLAWRMKRHHRRSYPYVHKCSALGMPAAADIPAPCEVPSGSKADGDPEADGTESAVSWNVCPAREEVLSGPVVADSLQGVPTGQSCDDKTVPEDDHEEVLS